MGIASHVYGENLSCGYHPQSKRYTNVRLFHDWIDNNMKTTMPPISNDSSDEEPDEEANEDDDDDEGDDSDNGDEGDEGDGSDNEVVDHSDSSEKDTGTRVKTRMLHVAFALAILMLIGLQK